LSATIGNLRVDAALTAFTALFDADEAGTGVGQCERAYARGLLQAIHGAINRRDRNRRAATAIHLFVEMAKNHAWRRQKARASAHDFRNRNVNVAIGNYGARANDQFRLQSNGVQGPGIGYPAGLSSFSFPKKYTFVKYPFHLADIVRERRKIKSFLAQMRSFSPPAQVRRRVASSVNLAPSREKLSRRLPLRTLRAVIGLQR
jgi:hypothetical protein